MVIAPVLHAQEAPAFQNFRFMEDWSEFDPAQSEHWSTALKHIELTDRLWVSMGGEQRIRYESWNNFGFGSANDDDFTLFRTHLHTEWNFGDSWRLFVEGRMNTVNNRTLPGGKRSVLDIDEGDFWNTFLEKTFHPSNLEVVVRMGRQELQFGAQRLVSPLDWANNRRIFDGGHVIISRDKPWQLDIFLTKTVDVDPNKLTNNELDDIVFTGAYYTRTLGESGRKMDAYLLGKFFDEKIAIEDERYTLGGRYYGRYSDNVSFDIEAALQIGSHQVRPSNSDDILAWMVTVEGTYTFNQFAHKPWITLGIDYATGDDDPNDGEVNTFGHLFPLAHAYLGFTDVVGRQNIVDYRATVGLWPMPGKLRLRGDAHFLFLEDDDDGLYGAGGTPSQPAADESEVGVALDFTALYKFSSHANLLLGYSLFFAGDYIEATGRDDDINFFYAQWGYTF